MDPHKILGVEPHASQDEIRTAYRRQALKYHPDRGGDAWAFQQIQDAYDELRGKKKKKRRVEPRKETPVQPTPTAGTGFDSESSNKSTHTGNDGARANPERDPFGSSFGSTGQSPPYSSSSTYNRSQPRAKSPVGFGPRGNMIALVILGLITCVSIVCGIWIWRSLYGNVHEQLAKISSGPGMPPGNVNPDVPNANEGVDKDDNSDEDGKNGQSQSSSEDNPPLNPGERPFSPPNATDPPGDEAPAQGGRPPAVVLPPISCGELESSPGEFEAEKKPSAAKMPAELVAPFSESDANLAKLAWARFLGTDKESKNTIEIDLVLIPPGEFMMGSPGEEIGRSPAETLHRVRLTRPYFLGATEVTNSQFDEFVRATKYKTEAELDKRGGHGIEKNGTDFEIVSDRKYTWRFADAQNRKNDPVMNVSWNDSIRFCNWLSKVENLPEYYTVDLASVKIRGGPGYRLPTEAEWEFAGRAGRDSAHSFPAGIALARYGNTSGTGDVFEYVSPVGTFRPNAFGLYDMHGNVWEWCWDWYGNYPDSLVQNPSGAGSGLERVHRGGSFFNLQVECRSAARHKVAPWDRYFDLGFRVARDP